MTEYKIGDRIELEIFEGSTTKEDLIKKGAKNIYENTIYPYKGTFHGTYYLKGRVIGLETSLFMGYIPREESDCNKYWVKLELDNEKIIETRKTNPKLRKIK